MHFRLPVTAAAQSSNPTKFFNVNEREETLIQHIDFSQPHLILEKLDGSMITPFEVDSRIRWGTKMGLTDGNVAPGLFPEEN